MQRASKLTLSEGLSDVRGIFRLVMQAQWPRVVAEANLQWSSSRVTVPAVASTATRSPSLSNLVTCRTLAMVGSPYSRAMIAPCESVPPISTTRPAASPKSGAIPGSITGITRMSSCFILLVSAGERTIQTGPSTYPALMGTPCHGPLVITQLSASSGTSLAGETRSGTTCSAFLTRSARRAATRLLS